MHIFLLLLVAVLAAWTPDRGFAQAARRTTCTVPIASSPRGPWQQVAAEGFTFCMPGSWSVTALTAAGDGSVLRWGTGSYRPTAMATETVHVRVGEGIPPTFGGRQNRFSEVIGGSAAAVWDNEMRGRFHAGATWQTPTPIWLEGQAADMRGRGLLLEIVRTVRFTHQSPNGRHPG